MYSGSFLIDRCLSTNVCMWMYVFTFCVRKFWCSMKQFLHLSHPYSNAVVSWNKFLHLTAALLLWFSDVKCCAEILMGLCTSVTSRMEFVADSASVLRQMHCHGNTKEQITTLNRVKSFIDVMITMLDWWMLCAQHPVWLLSVHVVIMWVKELCDVSCCNDVIEGIVWRVML